MLKRLLLLLFLSITGMLWADNFFFLEKGWRHIDSSHFTLYFPKKFSNHAQDIITTAEEVHTNLVKYFPLISHKKTMIILNDTSDLPNGSAQVSGLKKIILYFQEPDSLSSLNSYKNWFKMLLFHEYTHILQLDQANLFYRIFLFSPNNLMPIWMIEGLAVYDESKYTGFGRGNSAYVDMIFRSDFLNRTYPNLSQLTTFPTRWPEGNIPYLYGYKFYEYLDSKYGEKKIKEMGYKNNYILPLFWHTLGMKIFNKSFTKLYAEFIKHLNKEYSIQVQSIASNNFTLFDSLVKHSYTKKYLFKHKDFLYYYSKTPNNTGEIIQYNIKTKKKKILVHNLLTSGLIILNNRLYFTKLKKYNQGLYFYDLYSYNLSNHSIRRLTRKKRIFAPFSDGKNLYYISHESGTNTKIYEYKKGKDSLKLQLPSNLKILEAQKIGNDFFCIIKKSKSYYDIYKITDTSITNLTQNKGIETGLFLSEDKTKLLFSADYDSVYNFYELDTKNFTIKKLSHFLTSGFYPIQSNNFIYFIHYNHNGFGISKMLYRPTPKLFSKLTPEPLSFPVKNRNPKMISSMKKYNFFKPFFSSTLLLPYLKLTSQPALLYGLTLYNTDLFNTFDLYTSAFIHSGIGLGFDINPQYRGLFFDFSFESYFLASNFYIPQANLTFYFIRNNNFTLYYHVHLDNDNPIVKQLLFQAHDYMTAYSLFNTKKAVQNEKGFIFSLNHLYDFAVSKRKPILYLDLYYPLYKHLILENNYYYDLALNNSVISLKIGFPLFYFDSGYNQWPLFLRSAGLKLLAQYEYNSFYRETKKYLGFQTSLQTILGYNVPLTLKETTYLNLATLDIEYDWDFSYFFQFNQPGARKSRRETLK